MTKYMQEPPFACQIEFSEGCNLRCPFCGINGIRDSKRTYKFMSLETASRIATSIGELGWNCRTEFALHGEPTQNPDALKLLKIFRDCMTKNYFLIETNGSGFLGKDSDDITRKVLSYFEAGLDTIGLDEYQNVPWGNLVRTKVNREALTEAGITFHEYPNDPKGNPHQRTKQKRLVIIAPIDLSDKGTHASLNNHCGSGAPLDASMIHERCAKPFREISFRWDGSVSICCLAGDTLIQSPEGDIPISKLVQKFNSGLKRYPVYSVNPKTGEMKIKACTNAWKVGSKRVRELIFDDGTKLRVTHDHILYLRRSYFIRRTPDEIVEIKTGDLKVGDRIWAPRLFLTNGYWNFKKNVLFHSHFKNLQTVHRAYAEFLNDAPLPLDFDVHHLNENRTDNKCTNLQMMSKSLHSSEHARDRMKKLTPEERRAYAKRASNGAKDAFAKLTSQQRHAYLLRKRMWAKKASDAAKVARSRYNHKIVAINELSSEPVYDFTVEDFHTALVGSGVLVHNCNDWVGDYQIGNIHEMSVSKIWQHPRFMAARQKLLHKQRDFRPCLGCNNRSYRVGLLPDKFGKQTLPPPDVRTQKLIDEAIALGPYTTPVSREWDRDYDKLLVQIETNKSKSFI